MPEKTAPQSENTQVEQVGKPNHEKLAKALKEYAEPLQQVLLMERIAANPEEMKRLEEILKARKDDIYDTSYSLHPTLSAYLSKTEDPARLSPTLRTVSEKLDLFEDKIWDKTQVSLDYEFKFYNRYSGELSTGKELWLEMSELLTAYQLPQTEGQIWKKRRPAFLTREYLSSNSAKEVYLAFIANKADLQFRIHRELVKRNDTYSLHDFFTIDELTLLLMMLSKDQLTNSIETYGTVFDKIGVKVQRVFTGVGSSSLSKEQLRQLAEGLHSNKNGPHFEKLAKPRKSLEKVSALVTDYEDFHRIKTTLFDETEVTAEAVANSELATIALELLSTLRAVKAELGVLFSSTTDHEFNRGIRLRKTDLLSTDYLKYHFPSTATVRDITDKMLEQAELQVPFILSKVAADQVILGLKNLLDAIKNMKQDLGKIEGPTYPEEAVIKIKESKSAAQAQLDRLIETIESIATNLLEQQRADHSDVLAALRAQVRLQASKSNEVSLEELSALLRDNNISVTGYDGELLDTNQRRESISLDRLLDDNS